MERLDYSSRNRVLLSLLERDAGTKPPLSVVVPQIRVEDTQESQEDSNISQDSETEAEYYGWEKGEDLECDVYEEAVGL